MARIEISHKTEGPSHDPWSVEELLVIRTDGRKVLYHAGIYESVEIVPRHADDESAEVLYRDGWSGNRFDDVNDAFEFAVGVSIHVARRAHERIQHPAKCRCGSKRLEWVDGYPGEGLLICQTCAAVVATTFDESAVI